MKRIILATSIVAITSLNLVAAEPSAFGAGNLDSPSPYGLTSSEKAVLQNKQKLKKVVQNTNNQASQVESLRERIDGLQSIVESLSRKSQTNKRNLLELQNKNSEELKNSDEYEKRLNELGQQNSKAIEKNILLIEEISKLLDSINATFVSKDEFNTLVKSVNQFKDLLSKEFKAKPSSKKSAFNGMSNGDIATEAKKFYDKKYYTKGIEYYSYLITKNYKPANSHYMIGQMKFKRKNYAEAISFYKKSASLYSKASYMPELMLNTAISMDKTKDKKNAKIFYNAVITKYPNSAQAKSAKTHLQSMN